VSCSTDPDDAVAMLNEFQNFVRFMTVDTARLSITNMTVTARYN